MKIATKVVTASIVMLSFAGTVAAAPVYLSCEFKHPSGKPQVFNFALDESASTLGVFVPSTGSERTSKATFSADKVSLNEGTVAWEIDVSKRAVIRDMRMIEKKDSGTCKSISAEQSGFELVSR
ncbi:hypothetical protein [Ottowia thiooxydans]|uniref:hypothetical protein n=1 Tax=Ottowia thiooxydans TaxID=219182 RepID=UPI00041D0A8B|nr:hypothetical protein [Ottowia thiooxydans]